MNPRDRQILHLALPSIVSNISVPLLGLVDVAIVGHMGDPAYIGAISVGSMIFNLMYWVFGFLRMGTSGMTSQQLGKRALDEVTNLLLRSVVVGLSIAAAILLLKSPIKFLAFSIISPDHSVAAMAGSYFEICVWGAPAVLALYGLTGWYIGMQNTRFPMVISILQNVVNIVASLTLVYGFGLKVEGVAFGTLIAQYTGAFLALSIWWRYYGKLRKYANWRTLFDSEKMLGFFIVNTDIFLRTVCLVAVNLFFISAGSRQGTMILAVNTLLVQLYILYSYFLDGFAFAGEAMSGKFYGAHNDSAFHETVRRVFGWGTVVAIVFTLLYLVGGQWFLGLLTDDAEVVEMAMSYFPWAVAVPLAGLAAFVWDGVFIGITATRGMLVSSVISTICFFAIYLSLSHSMGNHALWMAFVIYLMVRGGVQTAIFVKCHKK